MPEMKSVLRKFQVESRELPLLELRGCRQHVMSKPRRFRHSDVHHDQQFERLERLFIGLGVRPGNERVAAVHENGANTVLAGMKDFIRQDAGRIHAGNREHPVMSRSLELAVPLIAVAKHGDQRAVQIVPSPDPEVPCDEVQQLFTIAVERGMQSMLNSEVHPNTSRTRCRKASRHAFNVTERYVGTRHVVGYRNSKECLLDRVKTSAML